MRFNYLFLYIIIFTIFTMVPVSAEPFAEGTNLTLKVYCNEINCTGSPSCNMTISSPDSVVLVNQEEATFQTAFYFYNFSIPQSSGSYQYNLFCGDENSFTSSFLVTPNGENPSTAKALFYLGMLALLVFFLILMFWAHLQDESHLARFWWFSFMWIPIWAIIFIGWSMARDFLTSQGAIESVLYYFWITIGIAYPFFVLCLILYTFYYVYQQKEVQNLIKRGFSLEDAQARVKGRGRGMNQW